MFRIALPPLLLLSTACPGPPKDVGALGEGDGSGGSDESSAGSLSASSTSAATTVGDASSDDGSSSGTIGTESVGTESEGSTGAVDCDCLPEQICTPEGCFGGQLFLNFDGPTMSMGDEDATLDRTSVAELVGPTLPFGGDAADRAALVTAVRERLVDVSLWITDLRPSEGDYSMIVLGDNLSGFGGALEVSPLECGHGNPRTVGFAGIHVDDSLSLGDRAGVVAHGIGHGVGLEHVAEQSAIMGPYASASATFGSGCLALSGASVCTTQHLEFCGAGEEDALAELQAIYGAP